MKSRNTTQRSSDNMQEDDITVACRQLYADTRGQVGPTAVDGG
jgi:hypothetical protein